MRPFITHANRQALIDMGFDSVVIIDRDISVRVPGAVQSAHSHFQDAAHEAERLSQMYEALTGIANGFAPRYL